ncbi:MAG TPA: alpha/beta hydrolase-fold protein, partial [Candidatus Limnocylindrales bacterium]
LIVSVLAAACGSPNPIASTESPTAVGQVAASSPAASSWPDASPSGAASLAPSPSSSDIVTTGGTGLADAPVGQISIGSASAHGHVVRLAWPAPWRNGRFNEVNVAIYLPPNFDPSGRTRYPVVYEAPYGISTWTQPNRFNLPLALDYLIGTHLVPPEIAVMLGVSGGPYLDSECANSFDGRSHIESWIAGKVVPWMDSHYPTVASRLGRAVMGASQGGYCAAALWSHHPDVFGASLVESGYFVSGTQSSQTPAAWRPFGGNAAYEASQSPIKVVPGISAALRAASLVLLEADPNNWFYGRQTTAFISVLTQSAVPYRLYADAQGHSWTAFGRETPRMLVDWARWMAARGIS